MPGVHSIKSQFMGMWLDHAGATIVTLKDGHDPIVQNMESNVESHFRLSGGWKSGMRTQDVVDEKRIERRRQQQLDRYYERLSKALREATRVLILGPGEAKLGLKRFLETQRSKKPRRMTIETANRMTERQLVAEVRRFFSTD